MAAILYTDDEYRQMFYECGFTDLPAVSGNKSCPYHKDRSPSMSINIPKGLYHCFSCGRKGSIVSLYKETTGHAFERTGTLTADMLLNLAKKKYQVTQSIPKTFDVTEFRYPYESDNYKNWLAYRGIQPDVAAEAGMWFGGVQIGYTKEETGEYSTYKVMNRVMIPIYDTNGKLSSLEMRYPFTGLESPEFKESIKKCLYPKHSSTNLLYEESKLDKHKKVYLLEGLMDCLVFRSLTGIKNSTTIFGATLSNKQKELLNSFDEICYVFNNDAPGLESVKAVKECYKGKFSTLQPLPGFDDVGDMGIAKVTGIAEWLKTEKK